jgi:hypothetical protein
MTWSVEQGKKEDILVAGNHEDQGGDPQGFVMREGSEGGKGMGLVHGGGMRRWALEGATDLRKQVGSRVRRRRKSQLHLVSRERGIGRESLVGAMLLPSQNQLLNLFLWMEEMKRQWKQVLRKRT